jgi:hypothetical protein
LLENKLHAFDLTMLSGGASLCAFLCVNLFVTFKPLYRFLGSLYERRVVGEPPNAVTFDFIQCRNMADARTFVMAATLITLKSGAGTVMW